MGERESSRKCTPRLDPTSLRNRIRRLFPATCATICRLQVELEVIKPFLLHNSSEQLVHSQVLTMVRNALTSGPDSCETCLPSSCLQNQTSSLVLRRRFRKFAVLLHAWPLSWSIEVSPRKIFGVTPSDSEQRHLCQLQVRSDSEQKSLVSILKVRDPR